jgi:sulfur-carrier protein
MTETDGERCEVVLPDALLRLYPEAKRRVRLAAGRVGGLIDQLDSHWPGMGSCLKDSRPSVRQHISILIDGERARLETDVAPGSTVYILTAISGG